MGDKEGIEEMANSIYMWFIVRRTHQFVLLRLSLNYMILFVYLHNDRIMVFAEDKANKMSVLFAF